MKKLILILALVFSSLALAQAPGPNVNSGRFMAANYGQWQTQVQSTPTGKACVSPTNVVLADGSKLNPWNTNAPLLIGSGGNAETVTPTAFDFVSTPGQVCISATYTKTHFFGEPLSSGTFGLQEALNAAGVIGGGAVTIDQRWTGLGGTTAMVSAAVLPTNVKIEDTRTGVSGGAAGPTIAPNQSAWYVSRNCGSQTNCTQIKGDGKYVIDATSNSTTTVTCPNNDCNFVAGDIGKKVWATTQGTGAGVGFLIYTSYVCPVTTIATVNSAQSITLNIACTASGTANVALYWGTDDGTALSGLDAAVGCSTVYLPDPGLNGNLIFNSQPFLDTAPSSTVCNQSITTSVGAPAPSLIGTGWGASTVSVMLTPDFAWGNCKTVSGASHQVCIGGSLRSIANVQFIGSGLTSGSNSNCANGANKIVVSGAPGLAVMYGVDVAGICPGQTGMEGVEANSTDGIFELGGAQEVGQYACVAYNAKSIVFRENDCMNANVGAATGVGLRVTGNAEMKDIASYPYVDVQIDAGSTLRSFGAHFFGNDATGSVPGVTVNGTWVSYGDYVQEATTYGSALVSVKVNSGGSLQTSNTAFLCNGAGCAPFWNNGGTVVSLGGNSFGTGIPSASAGAKYYGADILKGTAQGTCTAASTLGFYGFGQFVNPACTSAVVNLGTVMTAPTLSTGLGTLVVSAGTGGVNASSGVVTILKNNVATAITCTLGTSTFCDDQTHTVAVAAGDVISAQVTTQAADTLANVKITLLDW